MKCPCYRLSWYVQLELRRRHEYLVPVTPWCAGLFEYLLENRAADMRHVLLVLPFLLPDPEVQEYNRQNPREESLVDDPWIHHLM
jgi:hypothetical protein